MVADEERTARSQSYYTPSCINRWLKGWGDLAALAESPGTAHGLTDPRPTPETPKASVRGHSYAGDRLGWACVKADIERAVASLGQGTLCQVVVLRIQEGHSLREIAAISNLGRSMIGDVYAGALLSMAMLLGYEPSSEDEEGSTW